MNGFGEKARTLRQERKASLRTVAAYLDIDQAILSKIERGLRRATRKQVIRLARYFKADEEELLIHWLSDNLVYDVADEKLALKALQMAEEKIAYKTYKNPDRKAVESSIRKYFERDGRIKKAWLFGSFARGEAGRNSDIDLMIDVPSNVKFTLFDMADIQHHLEKVVRRKVDIVMRTAVKPHIMERVKPDLRIIYEG